MKAWRCAAYGEGGDPADAIGRLKLEEVPKPVPGAGEVECVRAELQCRQRPNNLNRDFTKEERRRGKSHGKEVFSPRP